jgi:uncharacterized membrane protein YeaQ/YmgE (transglycosylase-associated protein family)
LPPDIARSNTGGLIVTIESLIIFLIIGAVAGWLAGMIVKGFGFGLIGNCLVGIVGAFIAGFLLPLLGIAIGGGIIAAIINATIGAVILLVIIGFVKKYTARLARPLQYRALKSAIASSRVAA